MIQNNDYNSQRYEVYLLDKKIDLTYKEYELLKFLASNPNRVYSRDSLLKSVWDYDYFGGTRTVDVHIRRLRSKIDNPTHNFIETQWNVGYKLYLRKLNTKTRKKHEK